jgi:hypothetical protein
LTKVQIVAETLQELPSKDHGAVHLDEHSWASQILGRPNEIDRPPQTHLAIELAWASRRILHPAQSRSFSFYLVWV